MSKKVLISGYIGFSNFGDDAMFSVLLDYLKSKDVKVTALSSAPDLTKKYFNVDSFYYKDFLSIFREILKTDILISGGGNLFQNETSNLSLFYYLFIILLAKLMFKKVIVYSQGVGPVKGFFQRLITRIILKLPDLITVRDIYSQRILSKWGIKSKYTYDAAWCLNLDEYTPENTVGIQLRHYSDLHKDFYKQLAKYTDMYFSEFKIKLFSLQNSEDVHECRKFQKELNIRNPNINAEIVLYENPKQLVSEFSKLRYLIAMRLHANILGLKYGIRILPISYSVKVRNLAYEFNLHFGEAVEDIDFQALFRDLTLEKQDNPKIHDAQRRKFEWGFLDSIIDK